jgi:hypothetical protein
MKKIKHIKSPWEFRPDEDGKPIVSNGVPIAYMEAYRPEDDDGTWEKQSAANARLIEAAPTLLAILESLTGKLLISRVRSLRRESRVIDDDLMLDEVLDEAVDLLAELKR